MSTIQDQDLEPMEGEVVTETREMSARAQWVMSVLWPSFLAACVLELLVFGMVDPQDMHWFGGGPPPLPRLSVYTMAFFAFWGICGVAASITAALARPFEA